MYVHSEIDPEYPLYDPRWEHDACGTGFIAQVSGDASHYLVQTALQALANLTHRGAQDADAETGDGAGLLTQIPKNLFYEDLLARHITAADLGDLAVGMIFLPSQERFPISNIQCRHIIEQTLNEVGLMLLSWRNPPIDYSLLGSRARETAPSIAQVVLKCPRHLTAQQNDGKLYHARRLIEQRLEQARMKDCYIVSLSRTTIVHKGLLAPSELPHFYLDLLDPRYTSAFAIFHQRYSTNTFPSWSLAQPTRQLAHNGEINTIRGNLHWMKAREGTFFSPFWGSRMKDLLPVIQPGGSDSAQLDDALELLTHSGRDLLQSVQMLIPPAWEQDAELTSEQRAWCEFHAGITEPWDGPAALVFSDGHYVGAALDRNGLRPARYTLTSQGLLILASEAGVVPLEAHDVVEKGRLGPGEMIAVDLQHGVLMRNSEIKTVLAQRQPYQRWLERYLVRLADITQSSAPLVEASLDPAELFFRQQLFGYTHEDVEFVLRPMLTERKEPIWSMGDDTPLAALSLHSRDLSDYFQQRFAQVTNPPIDPLRERGVMSLDCYLGRRQNFLTESALHAQLIHLESPLLNESQLRIIGNLKADGFRTRTLNATFETAAGAVGFEAALERLEKEAVSAVADGATLLIVSDRTANPAFAPVPMLLAVGAIHQTLVRQGLRTYISLLCETAAAWNIHQVALLLGYGAEAVVPYLALASVRALAGERHLEHLTGEQAAELYLHVVEEGLRKVMARMGISTLRNIIGAGQFEIAGLDKAVLNRCFTGFSAHPGSVGFTQVAQQVIERCQGLEQPAERQEDSAASGRRNKLRDSGRYRFRRDAEYHAFNPLLVKTLQKAALSGESEDYQRFTSMVYQRPPTALRDLFTFTETTPISLEEVESMEAIRARFVASAMSVGALSSEAHRTIAAAMNSIGGRNNTGEGGEDPDWYHEDMNGYPVSSKIKQVASARFGVTTEYLVRAEELEIKMAQGSKPGEGGQLPPIKVTQFIARLRHTAPQVALISPPPHHDIYSIEDLAQLIYDLRQVNPQARIGVKLVASSGVGTIAAGVAKAHADYVLISGHDGGTGASPLQSIKHAGISWERGLAETQQQCHLNTCPTGIATQREDLRAKFTGRTEHITRYLTLLAEEVREWLARLGVARLDDLIGRADLLQCTAEAIIDPSALLVAAPGTSSRSTRVRQPQSALAEELLVEAEQALLGERSVVTQHQIHNYDRAIGAGLAGEIARRYGNAGLPGVSITCILQGAAGQSFGAFCLPGMRLVLHGEANDYVGKSMTGGQIIIAPPTDSSFAAHRNTILGNTVLYGATGGQLFAAGRAGERFAVRNSGALAVVEGVGAHACEYMTGGMVVVLGETGKNFAAGMSSGVAYVLDTAGVFPMRCNTELVELERLDDAGEIEALRTVIQWHGKKTRSWRAAQLLAEWTRMQRVFWRVSPRGSVCTASDFVESEDYDAAMVRVPQR
ncbi:MAG: glutamate synthase subunit alpha [Ktedonobacter sp. 13_1_20CM_4_53_11]|nr:MAG: glutamate synthase subunit alpha [Ktedonobacter sp. 13_1_20CM_4_53_11]